MNDKKYRWILYVIVVVITATIAIQSYWNYKNYLNNKDQLISDVQTSLDKAVDDYYTALAANTTVGIFLEGDQQKNAFEEGGKLESFFQRIDSVNYKYNNLDSLNIDNIQGINIFKGEALDSMSQIHDSLHPTKSLSAFRNTIDSIKIEKLKFNDFELLTSKIVVSITNDSLDTFKIDSLLKGELNQKRIDIDSELKFYKSDVIRQVTKFKDSLTKPIETNLVLNTTSRSKFLPKGSILELHYSNSTMTVLKRSLNGILISTLLVLAIISCLFYLLKIIKQQKQLAEVKNDLISNITHEFKTPIATIGVALESINNFNGIDDKEKTKKYINMSSTQLEKLNLMVEKLLETATLDSDKLELNKEEIDVVALLTELTKKYELQFPEKQFNSSLKVEHLPAKVDIFHIENAINNILDNAVKYGGDIISVDLIPKENSFEILISDNGSSLTKAHKEQIFEKFYRVPKGNTHDVKGFGIGLYYTKTIVEKHNGAIDLNLTKDLTTFKISLPNG